jgi:hypothetical protein
VPYSKCVPCRVRVSTAGACPGCGELLEPVTKLAEVMGFRLSDALDERLDADGWLTEGGGLGPEPLAAAVALPVFPERS